jgi:hypothetical protein
LRVPMDEDVSMDIANAQSAVSTWITMLSSSPYVPNSESIFFFKYLFKCILATSRFLELLILIFLSFRSFSSLPHSLTHSTQ